MEKEATPICSMCCFLSACPPSPRQWHRPRRRHPPPPYPYFRPGFRHRAEGSDSLIHRGRRGRHSRGRRGRGETAQCTRKQGCCCSPSCQSIAIASAAAAWRRREHRSERLTSSTRQVLPPAASTDRSPSALSSADGAVPLQPRTRLSRPLTLSLLPLHRLLQRRRG